MKQSVILPWPDLLPLPRGVHLSVADGRHVGRGTLGTCRQQVNKRGRHELTTARALDPWSVPLLPMVRGKCHMPLSSLLPLGPSINIHILIMLSGYTHTHLYGMKMYERLDFTLPLGEYIINGRPLYMHDVNVSRKSS